MFNTEIRTSTRTDVIQNSVNVGFYQLIRGYKQTFTIYNSFTVHHQTQQWPTCLIYLPLICAIAGNFNRKKFICTPVLAEKTQNTQFPE